MPTNQNQNTQTPKPAAQQQRPADTKSDKTPGYKSDDKKSSVTSNTGSTDKR